ncbi:hypothetical protein LSCM1_07161 [Leishmania martiniquensis]|uniref:Uncharacterized protein n=1 Tax=Leishmania martiniquensis TaxID=1580590 RepID=A0A836KWS4_9TRYP|nr:hypothetical protein LSCM1_07161 [Leishmania martiniquensis]
MLPQRLQLHACNGLALPRGIEQQPRPLRRRTINRLLEAPHGSCAPASGDCPATALEAEEPFHANENDSGGRKGRGSEEGDADAVAEEEEVIVMAPPPTVPDGAGAAARAPRDVGPVHTSTRYVRPYEEEDCFAMVATAAAAVADTAASAALAQAELDSDAGLPPRDNRKSAAEFYASVRRWSTEGGEPWPHSSAGDGQTSSAESQRGGHASECLRGSRTCHNSPFQKERAQEVIRASACQAASPAKRRVSVGGRSSAPASTVREEASPSFLPLLPFYSASARQVEASPATSSNCAPDRYSRRDSDTDDGASFVCSTSTTSTFAPHDDGYRGDGGGCQAQVASAECQPHLTVPASALQRAIRKRVSVQQGEGGVRNGEIRRNRPLTHGKGGQLAIHGSFSLAPRYRRHARYMALRDLRPAASPTTSMNSSTSASAFLQLFPSSPLSSSVGYEVNGEASLRAPDIETDAMSKAWTVIMKYCAAHHGPHAPRRTLL